MDSLLILTRHVSRMGGGQLSSKQLLKGPLQLAAAVDGDMGDKSEASREAVKTASLPGCLAHAQRASLVSLHRES